MKSKNQRITTGKYLQLQKMASNEWVNIKAGRSDKKPSLSPVSNSASETCKTIEEAEKNHSTKLDLFKRGEK